MTFRISSIPESQTVICKRQINSNTLTFKRSLKINHYTLFHTIIFINVIQSSEIRGLMTFVVLPVL